MSNNKKYCHALSQCCRSFYIKYRLYVFVKVTQSQNVWGWKESPEVICSNPPARGWASCPGLCSDGIWISPRIETPQPQGKLFQSVPVKQYFLTFRGFVPAVSSPVSRQHWKEPGIILLALLHLIYTDENPTCLVFRLNSPISLSFSS